MSRPARVLLHQGLARFATESGVGEAIRHQRETLRRSGRSVTDRLLGPWDVVHLNTVFPDTPLVALLARLRRKRVVVWAHSTEEDFRDSFKGSNTVAPLFRLWIRFLYSLGDVVVTPTTYSRDLLHGYGLRRRVHVLSNGVDTAFFAPDDEAGRGFRQRHDIPDDAPLVVSVGLQIVRKGILDWIELARRRPDVRFWWFGRTDPALMTAAVRDAIASAPPNCVFPGWVAPAELRDAYRAADVLAFLTHEETEGIVLLEGLSVGVPVLVRDIPIYAEWLPDGVVVHKARGRGPAFVADAARALDGMLSGDLPDLTAAGRAEAERLDLGSVAAALDRLYAAEGLDPA